MVQLKQSAVDFGISRSPEKLGDPSPGFTASQPPLFSETVPKATTRSAPADRNCASDGVRPGDLHAGCGLGLARGWPWLAAAPLALAGRARWLIAGQPCSWWEGVC